MCTGKTRWPLPLQLCLASRLSVGRWANKSVSSEDCIALYCTSGWLLVVCSDRRASFGSNLLPLRWCTMAAMALSSKKWRKGAWQMLWATSCQGMRYSKQTNNAMTKIISIVDDEQWAMMVFARWSNGRAGPCSLAATRRCLSNSTREMRNTLPNICFVKVRDIIAACRQDRAIELVVSRDSALAARRNTPREGLGEADLAR